MEVKSLGISNTKIITKVASIATTEEVERLIGKIIKSVKADEIKLNKKGLNIELIGDANDEIKLYENFKRDLVQVTKVLLLDSKSRSTTLYILTNVFNSAENWSDDTESHTFYTEVYQEYPNGLIEDITQNDILELMYR